MKLSANSNGQHAELRGRHALDVAAPIVLAIKKCSPELRDAAYDLFEDLQSGELDDYQLQATEALIADILFPTADARGLPGLDSQEVERLEVLTDPDAATVVAEMEREEATFAERLQSLLAAKGVTQAELAAKVGVGQPAISMMLNRVCRPQRKTVEKIATALGVTPEELWPAQ